MSDPDEIVEMFLKFPNGLSSSQKGEYERCSAPPAHACRTRGEACPGEALVDRSAALALEVM